MTPPKLTPLLPCPFCGGIPVESYRMDEDLWTHNTVEWRGVHCSNCDVGFSWPPDAEQSALEQWNRRAPTMIDAEELAGLKAKAARYDELSTPEIHDFLVAVEREALHQRDRWGVNHDAGKADSDWFWLIGFLAGKALHKPEKMLHHIITTAAACLNWHAARVGAHTAMRPGISGESAVMAPKPNHDAAIAETKP